VTRRWPTWRQKKRVFDALGYKPQGRQLEAHRSKARIILVAGGERAGKSRFTAMEIMARLPWCKRVALAAQEYDETRAEAQYIHDALERLGALAGVSMPRVGKWEMTAFGDIQIETISLQDGPQELTGRGQAYDIVALCEAGHLREEALTAARGRVAETRGLVILSGTLWDDMGWYADLFRALKGGPEHNSYQGERFSLPSWENLVVYPGGRQDPEIKHLEAVMPPDEFARLVGAELVPSPARIYPEFDPELHVGKVEFDPDLPVELAVDAGYYPSHYAVLALQCAQENRTLEGGSVINVEVIRQIDEIYEHHLTHQDIYDICKHKPWWEQVTRVVLGHEGKQHQAAESTQEVWQNLTRSEGKKVRVVVFNAGKVLDGIMRVRTMLLDPATQVPRYICDTSCAGTQKEFGAYKRKTDAKGNVRSEEPEDANNDAMDALRNWMVERYGFVERARRPPVRRHWREATIG